MHSRRLASSRIRTIVSALAAFAVAAALTGCTATAAPPATSSSPAATSTSTSTSTSASAAPGPASTPTSTHAGAVLVPDGSAKQNLPLFRKVVHTVWSGKNKVHGRAYIDALVKAGFSKKAMQVTEDLSTVGNAAESIQFSVLWTDGKCLVGQVGPETGRAVVKVMPQLGDGKCLLGKTRAIDW